MSYSVTILTAFITASACAVILTPLAGQRHRKIMALCLVVIPTMALGAYLTIGQPGKPGAYAAFDAPDSTRARKRDMQARIGELERRLENASSPAIEKLVELGALRQHIGRHEKAIDAFERARKQGENYATLPRKLGKAYFQAGIEAMRNGRRDRAANHWQKALKVAPRDAPYLPVIDRAVSKLKRQ
jgi:cytochrome c-type biogenesis protein CcmH/NrfG